MSKMEEKFFAYEINMAILRREKKLPFDYFSELFSPSGLADVRGFGTEALS